MRLILRRVRQRPFVPEHLAEIAAVHPAATGGAADEMLGLVRDGMADQLAPVSPARNAHGSMALRSGRHRTTPASPACSPRPRLPGLGGVAPLGASAGSPRLGSGAAPARSLPPRQRCEGQGRPDWEGLGELHGEVRTRQRHAVYLGLPARNRVIWTLPMTALEELPTIFTIA